MMADDCCKAACGTTATLNDPRWRRALWIALGVNAGMFAVEMAAGAAADSRALQADALDFLGDAANYAISLLVAGMALAWRARAALAKGLTLIGLGGWVMITAVLAALGTTWLARRARYVQLDMEDPAALSAELLYRWGIAAGDGGRRAALTVVCGDVREDTEGPAIYLTEDCGARQTPVWTSPRAAALAVPVTEPLAAVLTAAGKWQISDIHITDLLDIRTESHYNAT